MKTRICVVDKTGETWYGKSVDVSEADYGAAATCLENIKNLSYISLEMLDKKVYFNPENLICAYIEKI